MEVMKKMRWATLALALSLFPVTAAHAGVFISVTVAPPVLPVYEQPPCPEPDLMWVPGYWAYDYDAQSYYWVPGAWVPAPFEGALWTPPYWGWESGVYVFHPGYWGPEVGYYGGVNYGFGYFGLGFVGGRWHERHFEYNEAVWHVNRTYVHETYIDRTVIREHVIDERHVAYAGGPGGVHHEPSPEERRAMSVQHVPPTQYQQQHIQQARSERQNFFNVNHGRPQVVAVSRPLPAQHVEPPQAVRGGNMPANGGMRNNVQQPAQQRGLMNNPPAQNNQNPQNHNMPAQRPLSGFPDQRGNGAERPGYSAPNRGQEPQVRQPNQPQPLNRPAPQVQQPQPRPEPQYRPAPQAQPQYRPEPQSRPAPQAQPQYRPEPQSRPEPQYRPAPQAQPQYRPEPQYRPAPQPQARPEPQSRPAPPPRAEHDSRPAPAPRDKEHR